MRNWLLHFNFHALKDADGEKVSEEIVGFALSWDMVRVSFSAAKALAAKT